MGTAWTSPQTTSSSWDSSSRAPAVTPARVYSVLAEAAHQLGEAVALAHGMAGRQRAWSVAEAIREDADALALTQRAIRGLMADLERQTAAEVRLERARLRVEAPVPQGASRSDPAAATR